MLTPDRLRTALDTAGIGHTIVRSLGQPDRWVTACAVSVEDFARVVCKESTTEHQQALDFLCGLHTEVTIDGPPMAVAERIFDAVMAERRDLQDQIQRLKDSLNTVHRLYDEARRAALYGTQA